MLTGVERAAARRRLRRRGPGAADAPRPELATGPDTLAEITHIVVLMMENHSYDNYLGMLAGHGDGLPPGPDGRPLPLNPAADAAPVHLRHFAGTRQYPGVP